MQIFPTQYSTLSAVALNDVLQERYNLSGTSCRLLMRNVSDTYVLENETDKYIFKIYRDAHRKLDEIKAEVELLNHLKAGGAKVAYPLYDTDGGQLQSFNAAEGTRYGVLFTYAYGSVVYNLSPANLTTLGHEMALIHNISASVELSYPRKPFNVDTTLLEPLKTIAPAFKNLPDEYDDLLKSGHKAAEAISKFDQANFSTGYIHYDYLPKNFHITEDGKFTFFDFDFCGKGLLVNDLASFYVHYFMEVLGGKITQQQADENFAIFIAGYREVRPLSQDELDAIPLLGFAFWIFYLGFQYESFDDWSSIFFTENYLKLFTARVKKWEEFYLLIGD